MWAFVVVVVGALACVSAFLPYVRRDLITGKVRNPDFDWSWLGLDGPARCGPMFVVVASGTLSDLTGSNSGSRLLVIGDEQTVALVDVGVFRSSTESIRRDEQTRFAFEHLSMRWRCTCASRRLCIRLNKLTYRDLARAMIERGWPVDLRDRWWWEPESD
mgnify:CR=1 FL=1